MQMASCVFSHLGSEPTIRVDNDDITILVGASGHLDSTGCVESGPDCQRIEIQAPVQPGGDLPLLRVANASTGDAWKTKRCEVNDWPRVLAELDDQQRWKISYESSRLLIDGWRLRASGKGEGFVEILYGRAFKTERWRNGQDPSSLEISGA
jgi:hypothetical protein